VGGGEGILLQQMEQGGGAERGGSRGQSREDGGLAWNGGRLREGHGVLGQVTPL
jgi:hypothetical protein